MKYQTIFHIDDDDDDDDIGFFAEVVSQMSDALRCLSFTTAAEAWEKLLGGGLLPIALSADSATCAIKMRFLRQRISSCRQPGGSTSWKSVSHLYFSLHIATI